MGAVISHLFPDGLEKAFALYTLTNSKKNYPKIEKKAMSIVYSEKNSNSIYMT